MPKEVAAEPRPDPNDPHLTVTLARRLTDAELVLVRALAEQTAEGQRFIEQLGEVMVREMNDGGMGSLRFNSRREFAAARVHLLSELAFHDADRMTVFAALLVDDHDELIELDMFKGDGSPLIAIPPQSEFFSPKWK